jgi:universal stress protein A
MHSMAKDQDIDLIVVGSHGRHGLALIFGSTSNSVLHGATCDVLAVRISE